MWRTSGIKAPDDRNSRWFLGPEFLKEPPFKWPEKRLLPSLNSDHEIDYVLHVTTIDRDRVPSYLPNFRRFSEWGKLLRATASVLSVIDRWRYGKNRKISLKHIETAETLWLKEIQSTCYESEIKSITQRKPLNNNSKILQLNPMLDVKGILRVNGRLKRIFPELFNNNPIILDVKHHVTCLLIKYFHDKFNHNGYRTLLNEIRQTYWIAGLRNALR